MEVSLAVLLTAGIAIPTYQFMGSTTKQTTQHLRSNKQIWATTKFLEKLKMQLSNATFFPGVFQVTVLKNHSVSSEQACDMDVPSGLIPLPGMDKGSLPESTGWNDFAPSFLPTDTAPSENSSDAVRIAYFPPNSRTYPALVSSSVDQSITIHGEAVRSDLQIGEFAMMRDFGGTALIRLTGQETEGDDTKYYYRTTDSIWNSPHWEDNSSQGYRESFSESIGGFTLQRMEIVTYVHDPVTGILYFDNHQFDDGFNPVTQVFSGSARVPTWQPALTEVDYFRLFFLAGTTESMNDDGHEFLRTRNPQAGPAKRDGGSNLSDFCPNQVGFPRLRSLEIELGLREESMLNENKNLVRIHPTNLLHPPDLADRNPGEFEGFPKDGPVVAEGGEGPWTPPPMGGVSGEGY